MKQYKCIKDLYIDEYDEDGFATGGWNVVPSGSVWNMNENSCRIVGGDDTVHLDSDTELQWIEVLSSTLHKYFEEIVRGD